MRRAGHLHQVLFTIIEGVFVDVVDYAALPDGATMRLLPDEV
jgi:hypothetical protein